MKNTTVTSLMRLSMLSAALLWPAAALAQDWSIARIFGQWSPAQTNYNQVVPNRLFHPGGVVIDPMGAGQASRLYVYDSGNSRILGFDHVGLCVGGPAAAAGMKCTENSMCGPGGRCAADPNLSASIAMGQGLSETSSCNFDNTHSTLADAGSLCLVPYPYRISPLEGQRANQMAVDNLHSLYVVDTYNNRVLRYHDPFRYDPVPRKDRGRYWAPDIWARLPSTRASATADTRSPTRTRCAPASSA